MPEQPSANARQSIARMQNLVAALLPFAVDGVNEAFADMGRICGALDDMHEALHDSSERRKSESTDNREPGP
jgi:hypothetical protein